VSSGLAVSPAHLYVRKPESDGTGQYRRDTAVQVRLWYRRDRAVHVGLQHRSFGTHPIPQHSQYLRH
jgi:hypothetical protein